MQKSIQNQRAPAAQQALALYAVVKGLGRLVDNETMREKVLELKAELASKPRNPKPKVTKTQKAVNRAAKSTAEKVRKAKAVVAANSPVASSAPPPEEHPAPNGVAPITPAPH